MRASSKARGWIVVLALTSLLGSGMALAGEDEIRLETRLSGPRTAGKLKGKAKFRNRLDRARRQFSVEVERGRSGDMLDVMVSGVVVGTILINDFGIGELDYDDTADPDDQDEPFPRNFPELDGGEVVQVGPLTGTLQFK